MRDGSVYLLVVEDDPDILNLLETTLAFRGHRVITARNGREALDQIQRERPAVIVADIMMPKLDGFGMAHRLRLNPETRDIPIVFITATYVAMEDREFALNIGATRFIQKPIDLEKLLVTIEDLLERGAPAASPPPREIEFYDEYRRRLQQKLDQKTAQIARDQLLVRSDLTAEDQALADSLRHARLERDELRLLLEQVDEQMKNLPKPD
jgi:DNA-binding response OmpR family regulator